MKSIIINLIKTDVKRGNIMNITFLIGNGFDRNLGLKTTYADFVKYYKNTYAQTRVLQNFRKHIKDNEELWSAAEIALGQYTSQFGKGEAVTFTECQTDFCEFLAEYLKKQENIVDYEESKEQILKAFARINQTMETFPAQERITMNNVFQKRTYENTTFNFICFNYTSTLDGCLSVVNENSNVLGSHRYRNEVLNHSLGDICHVHGTVKNSMVFGVNDESQIAKPEIFECEDGDLYKNLLIKVNANASYLENTDYNAKSILQNSNLIYVYGMSIGETDKLWWERISDWLSNSSEHHLIVQKHHMPTKSVFPIKYQLAERKAKRDITKYSTLEQSKKNIIESRIHITDENIFEDIKSIAERKLKTSKTFAEALEEFEKNLRENEKELVHS